MTLSERFRDGLRGIFASAPVGNGEASESSVPATSRVSVQSSSIDLGELAILIAKAKSIAKRYRVLTGRPLGITGEVAEYEAVRLLNLKMANVRQAGYDAVRESDGYKLQVKGRCILEDSKPGQRIGAIRREKEWDGVLLVLMNEDFEPLEIYEADRPAITEALTAPGSVARNERGALSVSKFKSIGWQVWRKDNPVPSPSPTPSPPEPTPHPQDNVPRSDELLLVGYFLARCWSGPKRTGPATALGVKKWKEVYRLFYDTLGEGREFGTFCNSLRNTRDTFDSFTDSGRVGWEKSLNGQEQSIFDEWSGRGPAELWAQVSRYIERSNTART
jgi:hypothetical protein